MRLKIAHGSRTLSTRTSCRSHDRGFTLIELVVCIAIVGVLAGILLCAVQAMRESSRRSACQNHLRQIAVGIHLYHDAHRILPPGNLRGGGGFSYLVRILPYIEEIPLSQQADFSVSESHERNNRLVSSFVKTFSCPDDGPWALKVGTTNYVCNTGSGFQVNGYDGTFGGRDFFGLPQSSSNGPIICFGHVKDGLSNTALISECLIGTEEADPRRLIYNTEYLGGHDQLEVFAKTCIATSNSGITGGPFVRGVRWTDAADFRTSYNSILTPNQSNCTNGQTVQLGCWSAGSNHVRGVNLVFADGHVEFITSDVDLPIWRAISTRNGGD